MILLDRLLWLGTRLLPAVEAPWLDVPVGDGYVGADWPRRHARATGGSLQRLPDGGLLPSMSKQVGDDLDALPDTVRHFYEHTGRYDLGLHVDVRLWLRPGLWAWSWLWGRRWGQFDLPARSERDLHLTNEIYGLEDGATYWVRRYEGTDRALYVSRYDVVGVGDQTFVRIGFPVPGGAWLVMFAVEMDGETLVLHNRGGSVGGRGLYLVPPEGQPRYLRHLREEIRVSAVGTGIDAVHRFWLFGLPFLRLSYPITLADSAE